MGSGHCGPVPVETHGAGNESSPRIPADPFPQQKAVLSLATPHEWVCPVVTEAKLTPPTTACGAGSMMPRWPSPFSPWLLYPQQYAAPELERPQVWNAPASSVASVGDPVTGWGTTWAAVSMLPRPSWPTKLLPQQ